MADWQFHLEFGGFWHMRPAYFVAEEVVIRLKELLPMIRRRSQAIYSEMADVLENDILPLFEEIAEEKSDDTESFDDALEQLYDWADTPLDNHFGGKKMCWINTWRQYG